jgi:hypothetical protein
VSKILNHNVSFLKVELDNGSVLFLSKEDMEVYAEGRTIYLKQPSSINSFPFDSVLAPSKPTLVEVVKIIQGYIDQYIDNINNPLIPEEVEIPLTLTEQTLMNILGELREIKDDLKINNIHQSLITGEEIHSSNKE